MRTGTQIAEGYLAYGLVVSLIMTYLAVAVKKEQKKSAKMLEDQENLL